MIYMGQTIQYYTVRIQYMIHMCLPIQCFAAVKIYDIII